MGLSRARKVEEEEEKQLLKMLPFFTLLQQTLLQLCVLKDDTDNETKPQGLASMCNNSSKHYFSIHPHLVSAMDSLPQEGRRPRAPLALTNTDTHILYTLKTLLQGAGIWLFHGSCK